MLPLLLLAATDKEVKVKGKIGAKSKGCSGLGVCVITEDNGAMPITYATNSHELLIKFDQEALEQSQPLVYKELSFASTFMFEEDTELPFEITEPLGLDENYVIAQGQYPMEEQGSNLVVSIPLNNEVGMR